VNKDQKLLEEAYSAVCEGARAPFYSKSQQKDPLYFGKLEHKGYWRNYLGLFHPEITEDGSVRIKGDFSYYGGNSEEISANMDRLPYNFESVGGDFSISNCINLGSLEGSPEFVPGSFVCDACDLKTLKSAPRKVGKYFQCDTNQLTSLEGAPEHVGTNFWANENPITSLQGAPEFIGGKFASDKFSHQDYEKFSRDRRVNSKVSKELSKDFGDVDDVLKDF
jgi:hypothetical protein